MRLRAAPERYHGFAGDGRVHRDGGQLVWEPPADGGELRYRVDLNHRRDAAGFDAWVDRDWAIFRAEDAFPPISSRSRAGALSHSRLLLELPDGWQAETAYRPDGKAWAIRNPGRRLQQPLGWIAAGRLGIRRDLIDGFPVAIAAPRDQGVQRVGMLALLRWTLPTLAARLELAPQRLLIASAGEPMWRGGLSGPGSLFIHASRPLLSENGTSTLVHELVHVLVPVPTAAQADWIDEGLAEYLALRILRDSGSISARRFARSIERFRQRGRMARSLAGDEARGPVTARAVGLLAALDRELQACSAGRQDIYSLARALAAAAQPVDGRRLGAIATGACPGAAPPSLRRLVRDLP